MIIRWRLALILLGFLSVGLCRVLEMPATEISANVENFPTTTVSAPATSTAFKSLPRVVSHARIASPTPIVSSDSTSTPEYPANRIVIGYSVQQRPLEVYQFGAGANKRMIVAGIHGGNEYNTTALADELIHFLDEHADFMPANTTLFILRSLNPDGAARGRDNHARANENRVDLNRNFPALWQPDWKRDGCWNYLHLNGGSAAGSEPETQALMNFVLKQEVNALISYHSAALGIFPGGQPPDPKSVSMAEAISRVSDYPYPPVDTGCVFSGQLIDWASMNHIAAVDIELTNHHDTDFDQNLGILNTFLTWQP